MLFLCISTYAQVTTIPVTPSDNEEITIIFDATGTNLQGYTGNVYAHTGVTVNFNKWQYTIGAWGDNDLQPPLLRDAQNPELYSLIITPDIFQFYGVPSDAHITEISFIARSELGDIQTVPDMYIAVNPTNPAPPPAETGILGVVGSATSNGWVGPDITMYDNDNDNINKLVNATDNDKKEEEEQKLQGSDLRHGKRECCQQNV